VARRRVFYIPGYDPFPPRRYRELYRTESLIQGEVCGHDVSLSQRAPGANYGFGINALVEGQAVEVSYDILVWSDIVRASMGQGIAGTYLQLFRTIWAYAGSGVLLRLFRLRKGPMIAALYPAVVLSVQLGLAILAGAFAARLARAAGASLGEIAASVVAVLAAWAAAYGVLALFRRFDGRVYAWYLIHDYAFTSSEQGAYPAVLEHRLSDFRARIAAALGEGWDEVLVVGHSSGAHLAVSVLADLVGKGEARGKRGALSLLTLGQVVPMVSFLPRADRLRRDLAFLSERAELTWVDVSAPGDGCSFALCDPVSVSGMASPAKRWPLVISAAFSQGLSRERLDALRHRYFRLHFQYLCAFDRPGIYDYFAITSGPMTLGARFAGRAPSKSRIERPLNPFGATCP
jgi:hypothetical protein